MEKITREEFYDLLFDDDVPEDVIFKYTKVKKGEGGFDFSIVPNPDLVELSPEDLAAEEGLIDIGNSWYRRRRQKKFKKRLSNGENLPVLVSEGDSWFQFPKYIDEVVDQLFPDYLIWSVGAAGDTAHNMVFGPQKKKKTEYMAALRSQKDRVKGFLFSAAGNDIIGEDPKTKESSLQNILKPYDSSLGQDPWAYVDRAVLDDRMAFIEKAYRTVVQTIRSESEFEQLPIVIHGYDYAFPYPWGSDDHRDPSYADKNEWLGEAFDNKGYPHEPLRREILIALIDNLHVLLADIAGDSSTSFVWHVDCRGAMPDLSDWNDEIHGTSIGFASVADRFRSVLRQAVPT